MLAQMLLAMSAAIAAPVNRPVVALDLDRYAGRWHEIAHLPMFFQRRCASDITANYTPRDDGSIAVDNACRTHDGRHTSAQGVARPVPGQSGALRVRFAPAWLGWLPWVWAPYWVIELDVDYRWAVVGGPSRKYLWILSRTPTMDRRLFDALRERARARGYPVDKLVLAAPLHD